MIRSISILMLCLTSTWVSAQNNADIYMKHYIDSIRNVYRVQNYDQSFEMLNRAFFYASQTENSELIGDCHHLAGDIQVNFSRNTDAFQSYVKAVSFYGKAGHQCKLSDVSYKMALLCYSSKLYSKSIRYFSIADSLCPKQFNSFENRYALNDYRADAFFYAENYPESENFYKENIALAKAEMDTQKTISALTKLSSQYKKQKRYPEVLALYNELYEMYTAIGDLKGSYGILNNSGYISVLSSQYQQALNYFKEAEKHYDQQHVDQNTYAKTLSNIGICLQNLNQPEESVQYLLRAKDIFSQTQSYPDLADINNTLAIVYLRKYDIYNATEFSLEAIENAKRANDPERLKTAYKTYSAVLQAADDYQSAMDFFKEHLALRDSLLIEKRLEEQNIFETESEFEKIEKETNLKIADEELKNMLVRQLKLEAEKAEKELELLNKEKELAKSEKEMALKNLMIERQKHSALIKEKQIQTLEHDKELQSLILKQKETEEKERQKEIKLLEIQNEKNKITIEKQQEIRKRFIWTFGFVLIILILIVANLISARKKNIRLRAQKKQIEQINDELNQQNEEIKAQKDYLEIANTQINEQKIEIEKKNDEITDSIRYAQRIQTAVLPNIDLIEAGLSDYFVFYMPKDIVSGDFYWMKEIGENIVIAVADCTGHGVPGAFMSMLGISSLNELVTKSGFDEAGVILNRLRKKVKKSLGQTGKLAEQKDGMDMVLIIIDKENMKLQFAGANNPLIHISDGNMTILKPDRMPIGIYYKEEDFKGQTIDIKKGDIIYAYSDGFQDQFGGEKGIKFYAKRFKNLLFDIHQKPMPEQMDILKQTLNDWQSYKDNQGRTYEQIDDILVVGIKV